jgi:tripartite-type tricarboxylate transporter receptor subunit TctC
MNRKRLLTATLASALAAGSLGAAAQADYPSRPIRLVTMFAPGSNSDANARYAAVKLAEPLGVNVIVDNKAGGGGVIAIRDVYRAQPMGYSVLLANTGFVGNTVAYKEPGYKVDDYTPMGIMGQSYYGLIMHTSIPVKNLKEFVAYAKANPNKINYGGIGPAAGSTINAERFKQQAGINMLGVQYKGGEPVSVALLAGEVHVYWATLNTARNRMKNKQIIGLAITGDERSRILPDLPTFQEMGYPDMDTASWQVILAPSALPAPMLAKLRNSFDQASNSPEWKERMMNNELEPFKGTREQFMAKVRKEAAQLADDYRRLKLPQADG